VGNARKAVEFDVVGCRVFFQLARRFFAQGRQSVKAGGKLGNGLACRFQQLPDQGVTLKVVLRGAAALDFAQAVVEGVDQQAAAARVVQQIVLQVGVALHHPDVTQHFVQHAR